MQKIKGFLESEKGKDILIVIIVVLVGLGSFELGRLSKGGTSPGIKIEYPDEAAGPASTQGANAISSVFSESSQVPTAEASVNNKHFFASSRGKKYYPVNCSAGKSIKQENRVWFDTREEAEQSGYELSSSCN